MSKKVKLYSKRGCIACNRVVYLLSKLEIPYDVVYNNEESDITKLPVVEYGDEVFKNPISAADLYYIKKDLEETEAEK
jgi:glutaredoxin